MPVDRPLDILLVLVVGLDAAPDLGQPADLLVAQARLPAELLGHFARDGRRSRRVGNDFGRLGADLPAHDLARHEIAGAAIFLGMHAGPHTPGIIAHAYAFDSIIINGRWMNETGVNALVAGEYGVPVVMVSGDNIAMQQAREQLGSSVITVTTKIAIGTNAGVTWSPAVVRQMMIDSAAAGIRRAMRGEIEFESALRERVGLLEGLP